MNLTQSDDLVTAVCPCGCNRSFTAPRSYHKVYFGTRCQHKMKRKRMKERDQMVANTTIEQLERRTDADHMDNPTVEVIVALSKTCPLTRPMQFHGVVPEVPQDLLGQAVFQKQEDGTWLML